MLGIFLDYGIAEADWDAYVSTDIPQIPEGVEAMIGPLSLLGKRQSRTACTVGGPKRGVDRPEALEPAVLP